MTGNFLGCIHEALKKGDLDAETAAFSEGAYRDAYEAAAETLGPEDADREAARATMTALEKADVEAKRRRVLQIRTRRALLEGMAGLKERRGYTGVQALGRGKPGERPRGGWTQGGTPPESGPGSGGAVAAKALPLIMRNKGGLSGGPFPSVEGRQLAIRGMFDAKMAAVLEAFETRTDAGLVSDTVAGRRNRALLDNVVREAFGETTGDASAADLAKAWGETSELARKMFNAAGGQIGRRADWGLPQAHNAAALRRAGREAWVEATLPLLDRARMIDSATGASFTEKRLRATLGQTWERIVTRGLINKEPGEFAGRGSLALSRGEERFLQFKDATSWMAYQGQFGVADPFAAMVGHLDGMSSDIALMQILGPNPEGQFQWLKRFAQREAAIESVNSRPDAEAKARGALQRAQDMFDGFTGAATVPENAKLARWGATTRSYLNGALLGGAILTDAPSGPLFGAMARTLAGASATGDIGRLVGQIASPELRSEARRMGFINETARDALVSSTQDSLRMMTVGDKTVEGMNVLARKLPSATMRLSGLSGLFEARKRSFRLAVMATLADAADKSLPELAEGSRQERLLAAELDARGFTQEDWAKVGQADRWTPRQGASFLRLQDIAKAGGDELGLRLGEMVINLEQMAVPVSSSLWTRAALTGGSAPGTIKGELLRSLFMFKTFQVNALYQYAEEAYLRGAAQNFGKVAMAGWLTGLAAGYVGALTIAGAVQIQLKQLAAGKDPLSMTTPQFWVDAAVHGGGFGIMGDFLYSQVARNSHGAGVTAAGPVGSFLGDAWGLTGQEGLDVFDRATNPMHANRHDQEAARAARFLSTYSPLASLWWARTAFQRNVADRFQAMVDPHARESFDRYQHRLEHDSGQEMWWPRGQALPARAPDMGAAAGAPAQP